MFGEDAQFLVSNHRTVQIICSIFLASAPSLTQEMTLMCNDRKHLLQNFGDKYVLINPMAVGDGVQCIVE